MSSCCQPDDYDKVFDEKHARTKARDYARSGLTGDAQRIVDLIRARMPRGDFTQAPKSLLIVLLARGRPFFASGF